MNPDTLLLRQVHPTFVQDGRITSQVFRPTLKDESKISVYNGDMITPEESYNKFCQQANCTSFGVVAVTKNECDGHELPVIEDGKPIPEHCLITFEDFSKKQIETKAKFLKRFAEIRGWLYRSEDSI
jgi:hypothetical protein